MRTILLLITALVSLAVQAYEPLIREDRVWEYNQAFIFDGAPASTKKVCFKFDGTQEINSKTFHKLVAWFPDEENPIPAQVALMRETEEGKVYTILQQDKLYTGDLLDYSDLDYYADTITLQDVEENTEMVLYDFSSDADYADVLLFSDLGLPKWDLDLPLMVGNLMREKQTVSRDDKELKLTKFSFDRSRLDENLTGYYGDWYYRIGIVEGVGNIGRGYLHFPAISTLMKTGSWDDAYFVRQTDLDGNVIFDVSWLSGTNGADSLSAGMAQKSGKTYDMNGKPIENPESGTIYIRDGKKHIAR